MEEQIKKELTAIGKRLRILRKIQKLTQVDLEITTGIPNAEISRIENGRKSVELVTLIKLRVALNVQLKELF